MVALTLKTSTSPQPNFLDLPWSTPLEDWPDELAVRLAKGRHRHVVRFISHGDTYYACKELPPRLTEREYSMLDWLAEEGLPVVDLVGIAMDRTDEAGQPLESVLITKHLRYSLPYLHLFASPGNDGLHEKLIDALAILLTRIHLVGFFWGDCSLGNALFRRDAGALVAYLVDTETGERHDTLTDGQRQLDIDIACENIAGGLYELEALGKLRGVDPIHVVEQLQVRYDELWSELTQVDQLDSSELWRIGQRLERLNDLGFDTVELQLTNDDSGNRITFRPKVVEEGHHRRELQRLTGIEAEENQARRLLSAVHGYGAFLEQAENRALPDAIRVYRWLTERYEPTLQAVPQELRGRLTDAELYHQILDHLWYMSEREGQDIGLEQAAADFVATILPQLPDEVVVLDELD
ncbi:MAG: DUF4032 domain-containing protein [Acidimicrobiales bacterium]